jgi:methionyl aminopeptidase
MAHISEIQIKTAEEIEAMRAAGLVVARTLRTLASSIAPGVSTAELDRIAEQQIRAAGATPSFKGYYGYPATICASVNEEIVHGIPSSERRLRDGDIVSIDCGAIVDGWHGDAAVTVGVGDIGETNAGLLEACQAALWQGLAQAQAGRRLGDISHAVETSVRGAGRYGLVREYTGHGIGSEMHMDPPVPNYGPPGRGPRLQPGMALAIEPMVMLGGEETILLDDGPAVLEQDHHRRRKLGRALRAHRRDHARRPVGAHRRRRRAGRLRPVRSAGPYGGRTGHRGSRPRRY